MKDAHDEVLKGIEKRRVKFEWPGWIVAVLGFLVLLAGIWHSLNSVIYLGGGIMGLGVAFIIWGNQLRKFWAR